MKGGHLLEMRVRERKEGSQMRRYRPLLFLLRIQSLNLFFFFFFWELIDHIFIHMSLVGGFSNGMASYEFKPFLMTQVSFLSIDIVVATNSLIIPFSVQFLLSICIMTI